VLQLRNIDDKIMTGKRDLTWQDPVIPSTEKAEMTQLVVEAGRTSDSTGEISGATGNYFTFSRGAISLSATSKP
jgi:hypothetical protein